MKCDTGYYTSPDITTCLLDSTNKTLIRTIDTFSIYSSYLNDKEELQLLWQQDSVEKLKSNWEQWVTKTITPGITLLQNFSHTLLVYRTGIFKWLVFTPFKNPPEESDDIMKSMIRRAYGYRCLEYFTN